MVTTHVSSLPRRLVQTFKPPESFYYTQHTSADKVEWKYRTGMVLQVKWLGSRTHGGWAAFMIYDGDGIFYEGRLTRGLIGFKEACVAIDMYMENKRTPMMDETVPLRDWVDKHLRSHSFTHIQPDTIDVSYPKPVYAHEDPFYVETDEQTNEA